MASTNESYIKNALAKYKYRDFAKTDVLNVFSNFADLRPKLEAYVFNDGSQKDLLCLEGTIPVSYKGTTYNIPLGMWILDTHPYNPPLVYVRPTATMRIKQGKHVDGNGKIDFPYLREWKYPQSDLVGLIHVLSIVFGEDPPLYSTSLGMARPPYLGAPGAQQPYTQPGPYMPIPGGGGRGQANQPYPPAYTPAGASYPAQSTPYPNYPSPTYPTPGFSGSPSQPSQQPPPSYPGYPPAAPPPGPGYPPTQPSRPGYPPVTQQQGPGYPPARYPPVSQAQGPGYPPATHTPGPGYPPATQGPGYPPATSASFQYPYGSGSAASYPSYSDAAQTSSTNLTQSISKTGTVTEEHLRASMLSAVEDKMRRRLKDTFGQAQAEMDVLRSTEAQLQSGKEKLEKMILDLEQEKEDVEKNIRILSEKDQEIKTVLSKMENQDKVDIDEAVVPTAPLYKQLLNAFAEEQAIEDTIYYLGEALRRNVIDLDIFLKQVRDLSRRQYMLRALIQKCRDKAGLPALV